MAWRFQPVFRLVPFPATRPPGSTAADLAASFVNGAVITVDGGVTAQGR